MNYPAGQRRILTSIQKISPRRALIPIGIGTALSLFGDSTLYTVLPEPGVAAEAGVSLAMVGVLLGANRFARLLFNNLAGELFDRLPRRPLMIAAMIFGTLATLCYALGRGPAVMLLGRVLWGAAWSGIWIGANAIALDVSSDSNRGAVTGRLQMWFSLGLALTYFTGGLFTDLFGYRGGLAVSAGFNALGFLVWLIFLPETRLPRPKASQRVEGGEASFPWRKVTLSALPLLAVRFTFSGVLTSTTILWLSQYLDGGVTVNGVLLPLATLTGVFAAARVLAGTAGGPLFGSLSDLGRRRWAVLSLLMLTGTAGIVLMTLPWLGVGLTDALLAAVTASGVTGICAALVGDHAPIEMQSRGLGLVYTVGDVGAMLGPVVALALVTMIGIRNVYTIGAGLYGIVAVVAGVMALSQKQPAERPA